MIATLLAALLNLVRFLAWLLLGLLTGVLLLSPWLLRLGAVLAWLLGIYWTAQTIQTVYGPSTESLPMWALISAAAWLFAAVPVVIVSRPYGRKLLWGALYLAGLIGLAVQNWLLTASILLVQALPGLLVAALSFALTLRFRRMRENNIYRSGESKTPDFQI